MQDSEAISARPEFLAGRPVFDANHEKIGIITAAPPNVGYVIMQQGWLFPHDAYVPLPAIALADASGIYLRYPKSSLKLFAWDEPPTTRLADATGTDAEPLRDRLPAPPAAPVATSDLTIPLHAEELVAATQPIEIGQAHIHKTVFTEPQTISAPIMREQLWIERVAISGKMVPLGPQTFVEQDFTVPVMGEELFATKRAVMAEEIHVRKDQIHTDQSLTDTVRRERIAISGIDPAATDLPEHAP